jgi:hypothetical protein
MPNSKATGVAYSDPAIDGGTIDNTVIGGTTAAAGSFTTVTGTGQGTFVGLKTTGANLIASTSASTLGFFVSAAAAQVAMSATAAVVTTAAINSSISSSCFGYTSAQANAIVALVNALRAAGVTYGLWST